MKKPIDEINLALSNSAKQDITAMIMDLTELVMAIGSVKCYALKPGQTVDQVISDLRMKISDLTDEDEELEAELRSL